MKTLLLLLSTSALLLSAEKPNIIVILADDLGKEWIGCYGADDIRTPNTDHLIAFMKANHDKPMFLYHSMALPHTPMVATPDEPEAKSDLEKSEMNFNHQSDRP